jgi:hypothetical protein
MRVADLQRVEVIEQLMVATFVLQDMGSRMQRHQLAAALHAGDTQRRGLRHGARDAEHRRIKAQQARDFLFEILYQRAAAIDVMRDVARLAPVAHRRKQFGRRGWRWPGRWWRQLCSVQHQSWRAPGRYAQCSTCT